MSDSDGPAAGFTASPLDAAAGDVEGSDGKLAELKEKYRTLATRTKTPRPTTAFWPCGGVTGSVMRGAGFRSAVAPPLTSSPQDGHTVAEDEIVALQNGHVRLLFPVMSEAQNRHFIAAF